MKLLRAIKTKATKYLSCGAMTFALNLSWDPHISTQIYINDLNEMI